jgi:hypothetical protein
LIVFYPKCPLSWGRELVCGEEYVLVWWVGLLSCLETMTIGCVIMMLHCIAKNYVWYANSDDGGNDMCWHLLSAFFVHDCGLFGKMIAVES